MTTKKQNFTSDKLSKPLLEEDNRIFTLGKKLSCSTSYSEEYPDDSIMKYEKICTHDDGYLCEHRLEWIINYIKKNYE